MRFVCPYCTKMFEDSLLSREIEADDELLANILSTDSLICAECASDRYTLSSSTNSERPNAEPTEVSNSANWKDWLSAI